jgi:phosphoglycerol transferase MdoB-like AlkP superfamily enzyme
VRRIIQPGRLFFGRIASQPLVVIFFVLNAIKVTIFHQDLSDCAYHPGWLAYHFLIAVLLLGIVYLFLFSRLRPSYLVVFYIIQTTYLAASTAYYHFFDYYPTFAQTCSFLFQLEPLTEIHNIPIDYGYAIYLIDLPALVALLIRHHFPLVKIYDLPYLKTKILAQLAVILIICATVGMIDRSRVPVEDYQNRKLEDRRIVRNYGMIWFVINSYFEDGQTPRRLYPRTSNHVLRFPARKQNLNIILIQVEAMDAAAVTARYDGAPVMPFLNGLRDRCLYYPYVLSFHGGGGTSDCDFSVINSMEPPYDRSVYFTKDYFFPNSVVKIFRRAGYQALAFHGNTSECWGRGKAFRRIGYSFFWDIKALNLCPVGWGAPDEEVYRFTRRYLDKLDPPYFIHIITMSSHFPYESVSLYFNEPRYDEIQDEMVRRYFNSMTYTDRALQEFVVSCQTLKNTAIVIYGDHACNAKGSDFHNSKYKVGRFKLEFVPLFILMPDGRKYHEEKCAATFLDIGPTLLSISGLECKYNSDGTDLTKYPLRNSNIPFHGTLLTRKKLLLKCEEP